MKKKIAKNQESDSVSRVEWVVHQPLDDLSISVAPAKSDETFRSIQLRLNKPLNDVAWSHGKEMLAVSAPEGLWLWLPGESKFSYITNWLLTSDVLGYCPLKWSYDDQWVLRYGGCAPRDKAADKAYMKKAMRAMNAGGTARQEFADEYRREKKTFGFELIRLSDRKAVRVTHELAGVHIVGWWHDRNIISVGCYNAESDDYSDGILIDASTGEIVIDEEVYERNLGI